MTTPAGYQGTTQETSRVLKRGQLEFFVFKFFYDAAETQPVIPVDPQTHPNFRILSPGGDLLAQGIAVPGPSPGLWKVGWVVPKDAELTNVHKRYRLQTVVVDAQFRQFETSFEFDVVETAVPAQQPELQQLLTFVGEPLRVSFVNTVRPDFLRVKVIPRGMDGSPLHVATFTFPVPVVPGPNDLIEVERGNAYVYYTDVPAFGSTGEYSALWTVRDFPDSQQDIEHQAIEVIGSSQMFLLKSLRMLVDKLQKKLGIVYAYTNEDLIEYVKRGTALVNSYWPPTNFTPNDVPASLEAFTVLAAAWWGLSAQRILYAETGFDFSGQTVTLGYNPGADIDSMVSNFKEILDSQLKATKKSLIRAASNVGFISTRAQRNRPGLIYKLGTFTGKDGSNSVLQTLASYGIPID